MHKNTFYQDYLKRLFDIILSLLLIILLSPLFIILAVLIRRNLGSPVIFKQDRPGKFGKIFTIYKYRTMTNKTNEVGELLTDSVRLTRFGRLLRSTSLDELPELINIFKGEMSFVGPRPLSVKYLPYYNEYENRRHEMKPGLTGLSQVNGRNTTTWEERFSHDIYYIENASLLLDLKILLKTFIVVFKRENVVVRGTGKVIDFHVYRKLQNEEKLNGNRE